MATKIENELEKLRKENKRLDKEVTKLQSKVSQKDQSLKEKDLHITFLTDRLSNWADKFFELRTNFINLPIGEKVKLQERMQGGE